jgi:hypothetical protein
MMDLNRNQFFLAGVLVLLMGIQFRMVDSFVLNQDFAKMISKKQHRPVATASFSIQTLLPIKTPAPARRVRPPQWLGYSLLSIGAVLVLHSMAMRKPEGGS